VAFSFVAGVAVRYEPVRRRRSGSYSPPEGRGAGSPDEGRANHGAKRSYPALCASLKLDGALCQCAAAPAFGPGCKHSLLPALAKNMPQAYFLNASLPLGRCLFTRTG